MRRSLTVFFGAALLACALIVFPASSAWCAGPDWVLLDENQDSRFYYDQSGSKESHEGTVQVSTRVVYTKTGKADALKILEEAKKFDRLFESRYLHALDCKKEASRLLEVRHLDKEGVTLKSTDLAQVTEWEEIPADARIGLVFEKVCPAQPVPK